MHERTRLAYLDAMGVDSYFPIYRLPGAAPSPVCDMPPAESVAVDTAATSSAPPVERSPTAPRRAPDLSDLLAERPRESAAEPVAAATGEKKEKSTPRFELRLITSDCGFMILDGAAAGVPEKPLLRFVSNLLLALTGRREAALDIHPFRWPMADNPLLDSGEAAAREALQASVRANIERHSVRWLMLMGETAAAYLDADGLAVTAITLPAADEVFRDPQRKREIWEKLKTLVQEPS